VPVFSDRSTEDKVKLIVTLKAVLVEARSQRPISLVAERISSKLGRTI
jgi:hypothetical protein